LRPSHIPWPSYLYKHTQLLLRQQPTCDCQQEAVPSRHQGLRHTWRLLCRSLNRVCCSTAANASQQSNVIAVVGCGYELSSSGRGNTAVTTPRQWSYGTRHVEDVNTALVAWMCKLCVF
jgi:hypothetical protein